jgi:chromosome segregation protein
VNLKHIKAFGFKTFADPTTLTFSPGITAIVGPNGSGKSNLVDAFRWSLGETSNKSLRGGKLEDVIFAGNDSRKPLGLAEVSVLFDNSDGRLPLAFDEVEITRRTYRTGDSEYFINRSPVRLRDIADLLSGTGLGVGSYAMISQGQIDAVLTSKPTDRRVLFEETAGIGRFLARKNESLRRLEQTERNAVRLNDLIVELERRGPELETQVRRAKRYRKVSARVRDLEILGYLRAGASRRAEREAVRAQLDAGETQRVAAAANAASLGAKLTQSRTAVYRQELALEEARTQVQTRRAELARFEADYAAALARREALERQSTHTAENAARAQQERTNLEAAIEQREREIGPLILELEAARERELDAANALTAARAVLESVFTQLRDVEAAAAERAAVDAERRVQAETLRAQSEQIDREMQHAREASAKLEIAAGTVAQTVRERGQRAEELEARKRETAERLENAEREASVAQDDLAETLSRHRDATAAVTAAESRLHTIEELENALEGHVPGTRAVVEAWQRDELRGIEGIVSNLVTIDERYARAMDVAFGARLSNVITTTSEDAERCIEFLNRKEAGRATFLPLDTLRNRDGRTLNAELARVPGVIGYAHSLVETDDRFRSVVNFLVGNVLIVDRLQTGIDLVRSRGLRDTLVTLGGEQITGGGAITGGRFQRERSILSRRALARTLRETLVDLRAALERGEAELAAGHKRAQTAIDTRESERRALAHVDMQLVELRAQAAAAAADARRIDSERVAAVARVEELTARQRESQERHRNNQTTAPSGTESDAERARLEDELAKARVTIGQAEERQSEGAARSADIRERLAALTADRDAARARRGILDDDGERATDAREVMLADIATLAEETRSLHARVEGIRRGVTDGDAELDRARRERERFASEQLQIEADLKMAEHGEREASAAGERDRTRLAEIDAELGMLVSQFAANPAGEDECRDVEARYDGEADEIVDELPRLREELARLATNANLNAEAERDELEQRRTFLREQMDDLTTARETLLQSIREIERETQTQFNETFAKVAEAFAKTFAEIFPGGQASMWQSNPENLSETGIEIAVAPPGKKSMPLAALSGGERAMTAAALIFALMAVRPSPFYLLDEVDAALDDANVERFASMIRKFSANAQMIVVTHNKRTMELADRLYGVTMREPGVSAIVSAELAPLDAELSLV